MMVAMNNSNKLINEIIMYVNWYPRQMPHGQGPERGVQQVRAHHMMVAKEVKWQMLEACQVLAACSIPANAKVREWRAVVLALLPHSKTNPEML